MPKAGAATVRPVRLAASTATDVRPSILAVVMFDVRLRLYRVSSRALYFTCESQEVLAGGRSGLVVVVAEGGAKG